MSRMAIGGFASGLASGLNQGVDLMMKGQQYAERNQQQKARKALAAHGEFDPMQNPEPTGDQMGPMPPDPGMAWQQFRDERIRLASDVDPQLGLLYGQVLDEQHKHLLRTSLSMAGLAANANNPEGATESANKFLSLIAPGAGYRLEARLETDDEGNQGTVFYMEDGTPVNMSGLQDALGMLEDPMKWEYLKAEINKTLAEAHLRSRQAAVEGTPAAVEYTPDWDAGAANTALDNTINRILETGEYPEEWMGHLSTETVNRWFSADEVPPAFQSAWRSTADTILRTMQGTTSPDEAARLAFQLEATMLDPEGAASNDIAAVPGMFAPAPGMQPMPAIQLMFPDGSVAVLPANSNAARRFQTMLDARKPPAPPAPTDPNAPPAPPAPGAPTVPRTALNDPPHGQGPEEVYIHRNEDIASMEAELAELNKFEQENGYLQPHRRLRRWQLERTLNSWRPQHERQRRALMPEE